MKLFVVTYVHPDEEGWQEFLAPHIAYLEKLTKEGSLCVSGPFVGTPEKSAMLILSAPCREDVLDLIAKDPFMVQGLVLGITVTEWKPMFGSKRDQIAS
jgi:uncharacterized protein